MDLSPEQLERYARNIVMKEIGIEGQKKLLESSVLVIGSGGLGSPAILYLAASGVGTIGIVDNDVVDLSNLQRQIAHGTSDVGKSKVASAAESVREINPDVRIIPYELYLTSENISEIIEPFDYILECVDGLPTKFLINDACVLNKKPFTHASIVGCWGELLTYVPNMGPCYRCWARDIPRKGTALTAKEAGIIGALGGMVGSMQALEAIKYLLGRLDDLVLGRMLMIDALSMDFDSIDFKRDDDCPVCSSSSRITTLVSSEYE